LLVIPSGVEDAARSPSSWMDYNYV
jgi:hypothetical protein